MMRKQLKRLAAAGLAVMFLSACQIQQSPGLEQVQEDFSLHGIFDQNVPLEFAKEFTIAKDGDGCTLLTISQGDSFLVIPEGNTVPGEIPDPSHTVVLMQPLDHIYLAATSAMDFFSGLDSMDSLRLSGTKAEGWYVEAAKAAMEEGNLIYAGKYSQPDYELLLDETCRLAIESTMIYHKPEVKEKLEQIGIPVLVERSSYETDPLGRMEWVKFYGALLGKEEEAERVFHEKVELLKEELKKDTISDHPTVAFFYVTPRGYVNVRKSGDYISKMIQMAGGTYIFKHLGDSDSAMSAVNLQMEEFYAVAKEADYLIYNSTVDGEVRNLEELFAKSELLRDFKAVREGHVWCTSKQMFQNTMGVADMIADMHRMFQGDEEAMVYLFPIR